MTENYNISDNENTTEIHDSNTKIREDTHETSDNMSYDTSKNLSQNEAWREKPPLPPNHGAQYNRQYQYSTPQNNNSYHLPYYPQFTYAKATGSAGFSIASLVLGISSVITIFCKSSICLVCAILALIFGIISLAKHGKGKGMAIAGVILGGAVLLLFYMILLILLYALFTFEI